MRYIDREGDVWADVATNDSDVPDLVRCVRRAGEDIDRGLIAPREDIAERWGPLTPLGDGPVPPLTADATPAEVMSRGDVFRAAHALVGSLAWDMEKPSVFDVLSVAKWLGGESE
ncbi:hypothetical protein NPS70_16400 [Streptomyces sp. C10-9-1]|uniref:hypothetical protein n=1 Tax=Streptomyces sp. C10-9-1 TaxID=1859285 RepID=UPI002110EE69|nr:hypothetical protein [Streptomyces sp. C10-9-1]MCQ6554767.1 hypothetical protein [Streptomyces sp. C10-9-1]